MPALYVIRHAEAAVRGVLLGGSDPGLSESGRLQAQKLTATLPQCVVYASPLRRAVQTALFIAEDPIILPGLAEISYGEWDGLTWGEIERKWPDIARKKLDNWQQVISPGGEAWDEFRGRVLQALRRVLADPVPAAVVAHEAVNAVIAQELTGAALQSYKQRHCEIVTYDI